MCYYSNMDKNVLVVNKKRGQTPLDCINELKNKDENLKFLPMTYAGRLDPLAEGVLLLLAGDECLKKEEYLKLPKVYEVSVLFGFSTDTYDVLGKVEKDCRFLPELFNFLGPQTRGVGSIPDYKKLNNSGLTQEIKGILEDFTGYFEQKYPPYSSKTVLGKPLFVWAREGRLNEIEIPSHNVFIEKIEILKEGSISGDKLLNKIKEDIGRVKGDFRQEKILGIWEEKLKDKKDFIYKTIDFRVVCGSGVYMRSLANDIGDKLKIPTLALDIKRTRIGNFGLD